MWIVRIYYRGGSSSYEGPFESKEAAENYVDENNYCPGDEHMWAEEVDNLAGFENGPWELTWPNTKRK